MCFSAAASFTTAAATGLLGAIAVAKAPTWRERPLAAIPLVFAAQQALEGGQWLALGGIHLPVSTFFLANAYAFIALAVWPAYSPIAIALVEQDRFRRLVMIGLAALGAMVALYGATHISAHPYAACIVGHSISYSNDAPTFPHLSFGAYVACGCLPLALSSHKAIRWFGAIVIVGLVAAWIFYFKARFSVWCFFAALASATVCFHFVTVRRMELNTGSRLTKR